MRLRHQVDAGVRATLPQPIVPQPDPFELLGEGRVGLRPPLVEALERRSFRVGLAT